jgi:hypothetical protein
MATNGTSPAANHIFSSNGTSMSHDIQGNSQLFPVPAESYDLLKQAGAIIAVLTLLAVAYFVIRAMR